MLYMKPSVKLVLQTQFSSPTVEFSDTGAVQGAREYTHLCVFQEAIESRRTPVQKKFVYLHKHTREAVS